MMINNDIVTLWFEGGYREIVIKSAPSRTVDYIKQQIKIKTGNSIANEVAMINTKPICFYYRHPLPLIPFS